MQQHPFITETPTRQFLRNQVARLTRVIAQSDQPERVTMARRYAARCNRLIATETDWALDVLRGEFGVNGWGAAVDDICRHVESGAVMDGEPIDAATAAEVRQLGQPVRRVLKLRHAA